MADGSDKTEKPTSRKRRKARERGQIPRSRDLAFALTVTLFVIVLGYTSDTWMRQLEEPFYFFWSHKFSQDITATTVEATLIDMLWFILVSIGPWVILISAVSVGSLLVQGGFQIVSEPLKPSLGRMNPANNVKKIFSKNGLVQLLKSLILVSIIVYLAYGVVTGHMKDFSVMPGMGLPGILALWGTIAYEIGIRIALCLLVLGAADLAYQHYAFEEGLMMTKQEVRDEFKDTEGNPQIKGRIRKMQITMARRRMMAAIKEADVVVTNPTHFAVALKFDLDSMAAPQVVAKGQDFLAKRIREIAEEHKVPIVEDVQLARTLYKNVEIGEEIPVQHYRAVAQILAYVYKLKKKVFR